MKGGVSQSLSRLALLQQRLKPSQKNGHWSLKWNLEHAEEVHSSTLDKHRHHRKKHPLPAPGVEEEANCTTTLRFFGYFYETDLVFYGIDRYKYTSEEIVENKTHKDGKEETKIIVPDHREAKQPIKEA